MFRRRCGIDRVLRDQFDLAPHHAAGRVDFFSRHLDAELRVATDRTQKTGQWCEMADLDRPALRASDGRKSQRRGACECRALERRKEWLAKIDGYRKEWEKLVAPGFTDDSQPVNPQRAAFEIQRGLPDDAFLVSDIGVHHNWLLGYCKPRRPDSLIGCMAFGAMGFGVAGVLGAKFAAPDRPCVSVCGDGAFFMQANVLGTAVEYNLPAVRVVWNNYAYASIRGLQRGYLDKRELATDFHNPVTGERYNPDFAAMARSCGVEGVRVDRAADIADAIKTAIAANKPYLIDVDIAADINPAGAGVWELPGLGMSKPSIGKQYVPS
jgi:acetolactate synthase-1/2/3 large subunit